MSDKAMQLEPGTPSTTSPEQGKASPAAVSESYLPDLKEAQRFLTALAPDGAITFQTLPERKQAASASAEGSNRLIHGRFGSRSKTLSALNEAGAGIFVMVNRGNGKDRKSESVSNVRAIFVDLDGSELQPVLDAPIPPSITVESSPGRYHAYWLVRDIPLKDFKPAQQALAAMFGGDKSVCDLPRLMRLPGFYHQKSAVPFKSRLLTCEPELVWRWKDLAAGLGLPSSMYLPDMILEGERNNTIFKLAASGAITGTSKSQKLDDLLKINRERCKPPLPEIEVKSLVERAYRDPPETPMKVPVKLLQDERFLKLRYGPKCLMLLIHQKFANKDKGSEVALLWKDFNQHFPRENTFKHYRSMLAKEGLLTQTKKAKKLTQGKTDWNLYKLVVTTGM